MKLRLHAPLLFSVVLIFNLTTATVSYAVEVIRANFEFNGAQHPVDISLFDGIVSGTVNNFLAYVNSGDYDNLIINRNVPGFVIQAGAYTYDPANGGFTYDGNLQFSGGLQLVPQRDSITNEFKLSNLRGTLSMARIGGQIDSASNQWFINLADNLNLDTVDEGYTVFGEILGNGMDAIDLISDITPYDLSSEIDIPGSFISIPLIDFTISSVISEISSHNLVTIKTFDPLFKITDIIDFGDAVANTTLTENIIIENTSNSTLQIGAVDTSSVAQPFTVTNPCQNVSLAPAEQCSIQVDFNPLTADFFADTFNIEIASYNYTFPVTLKTPAPDISIDTEAIDFGTIPIYDPEADAQTDTQRLVYIYNEGDRDLALPSITFDSATPDEFYFIDNCTTGNRYKPGAVDPGGFCILVLFFRPQDLNEKSATITINSDDPDTAQIVIPVKGGASSDDDGIDNIVEDSAPNAGDGNNDDIPDRLQSHVASFANTNSTFTTLITNTDTPFSNVATVQLSTLDTLPEGVSLDNEAFSFELSGFPDGSVAEFGLILAAGNSPANIYAFSATASNSTAHWYALEQDNVPGVIMFGNAPLTAISGDVINRNITTIRIIDGGDGDADQQVNGRILFVGGPEMSTATENTDSPFAGSLLWLIMFIPLTMVTFRKH